MRTLVLASPYMKGKDVKAAQKRLITAGYLGKGQDDGTFGPVTGSACVAAKWELGYAKKHCVASYGQQFDDLLAKRRRPTATMRLRARRRTAQATQNVGARAADVMAGWYVGRWKEKPAGSNVVPELQEFARTLKISDYYVRMGWPWCAFAVGAAALHCGSSTFEEGLRKGKFNSLYCPELRAVSQRGAYGMQAISPSNLQKGHAVLFDWQKDGVADHIGLALGKPGQTVTVGGEKFTPTKSQIVCVEGNTAYDSKGSQSNGGCVAVRVRDLSSIQAGFSFS